MPVAVSPRRAYPSSIARSEGRARRTGMAQRRRIRLRSITAAERAALERAARAGSAAVDRVARAKALLAVADGATFVDAARVAGRRSGDAVAHLVERFNAEGTTALD